ncbi:MAG: PAS domain-containing protein, partial [Calditrichaeota bacterium]
TKIVLKNIADGVIVTDESNHIILMNPVAMDWFGFKNSDQFLAKSIDQVIPNEELVQLVNKLKETEVREINTTEILLKGSDGWKKVILQARATNIFDEEENRWSGVVTVLRDITKEKEIDRMKTELVSMVAHELRSPLTSISGFSELLLDPNTAPEQTREYATIILKESNRLNELINKFLDISKIESGKIQMRKIPVDLKLLIAKVLEYNGQLANKKNIQVEIKAPPHISEVMVDKDMMEQVVLNLFSNAVKYSPENARITIRVFENKNTVGFEVEDTGYGIPENALPRIFDKFYRVSDNEQVQEVQGSGLGLALVKQIVEIHNGDIRVQSSVGEGSTFTVTLPKTATTTPKKLDDMMIV